MEMDFGPIVDDIVRSDPIVIFGYSGATQTEMVRRDIAFDRRFVRGRTAPPLIVEIDKVPNQSALRKYLKDSTGIKSFPIVYLAGEAVGGANAIRSLRRSRQLPTRIAQAYRQWDRVANPQRSQVHETSPDLNTDNVDPSTEELTKSSPNPSPGDPTNLNHPPLPSRT